MIGYAKFFLQYYYETICQCGLYKMEVEFVRFIFAVSEFCFILSDVYLFIFILLQIVNIANLRLCHKYYTIKHS